jgi:hypothetical protein
MISSRKILLVVNDKDNADDNDDDSADNEWDEEVDEEERMASLCFALLARRAKSVGDRND